MKKIFLLLTLLISTSVFAQLPPAFQADGIQVPFTRFESLTTVQRDALTPVEGDFIYNTDIKSNQYYNGTTWISYQKEIKSYTTVQRDALTPDNFDVIYNSTDTVLQYWDGDSWEALGGVDQSANYTWTGIHNFSATAVFNGGIWAGNQNVSGLGLDPYNVNWDSSTKAVTQNDVYDKIESLEGFIPPFGITGQVLVKSDNFNYNVEWQDPINLSGLPTLAGSNTFTNPINYFGNPAANHLRMFSGVPSIEVWSSSGAWSALRSDMLIFNNATSSRSIFLKPPATISNNVTLQIPVITVNDTIALKSQLDGIVGGSGDMLKSTYDPTNINASAFDYNNFINTPTIPTNSDYVDLITQQTITERKSFNVAGTALLINNNGLYNSLFINNLLNGNGIYLNNASTGSGIVLNGETGSSGYLYRGQNNGVDTFTVNKTGDVVGNTFNGVALNNGGSATNFLNEQGNYVAVSGGSSTFVGLTDTPANFTGSAGKFLRVNSGASALEFTEDVFGIYNDSPIKPIFWAGTQVEHDAKFGGGYNHPDTDFIIITDAAPAPLTASDITDFDTEVSNNTDVVANTAKTGITAQQASDITTNNAKVSFPEAPSDGTQYARKDGVWEAVSSGSSNNVLYHAFTITNPVISSGSFTVLNELPAVAGKIYFVISIHTFVGSSTSIGNTSVAVHYNGDGGSIAGGVSFLANGAASVNRTADTARYTDYSNTGLDLKVTNSTDQTITATIKGVITYVLMDI